MRLIEHLHWVNLSLPFRSRRPLRQQPAGSPGPMAFLAAPGRPRAAPGHRLEPKGRYLGRSGQERSRPRASGWACRGRAAWVCVPGHEVCPLRVVCCCPLNSAVLPCGRSSGGCGDISYPASSRSGLALLAAMKISATTEYACVAMLELAANYGSGEPVPVRTIAERHGVPDRFLVQILLQLKAAGLVASARGAAGGYRLARPPAEVSLGQVMDVIGGSTSATKSPSASSESPAVKVLMRAWRDVADEVGEMLGRITFDELVDRAKESRR